MTEVLKQIPDSGMGWPEELGPDEEKESKPGLPEVFGPFVLTKRLGSGGVAEVYRGYYEDDPVQSPIALKRLVKPSERGVVGLLEEARLSGRLESRYIVRVIDQTRVNNRPCLVMEFVNGPDLATLIRRVRYRHQAFPTEVILAILLEVARAIQVAHGARDPKNQEPDPIIHFDLKPSNILISRDGQVKLSDFGVARQQNVQDITQEEGMIGTLSYMAPERVSLERGELIDHRIDLFSIGAIGFELCTLQTLFNGSQTRMIQQLLNADTFVPLALEKVPDYVNPELKAIIGRLLEADPGRRYADAGALIRELEALRDSLRLPVDLSHFVGPYLAMDVLEEGDDRVTAHLPSRRGERSPLLKQTSGPITHLSAQQLTELLRRVKETVADPGILARQRERRRRRWIIGVIVLILVIVGTNLAVRASLPTRINITSDPESTLVAIQPGCEGSFGRLQPAPLVYHSIGPWPVCLKFQAPGHVPLVQEVYRPSVMRGATHVDVKLIREVCVDVDSKPKGLPIYIANIRRGVTGNTPVRVCGFEPGVPYYVQIEYRGERWDVQEMEGMAGQTLVAFHDFGGTVTARSTPMQRCRRYFRARNYQRAVEICRVAVTQAADHTERVEALVIEGRAFIDGGDQEKGCDVLHSALGTAVVNRDLGLEREVQDWRLRSECGPAVSLTEASQKAADKKARREKQAQDSSSEEKKPEDAAGDAAAQAAEAAAKAAEAAKAADSSSSEGGEVVK